MIKFPKFNITHMASSHEPASASVHVCFHSNRAADLSDRLFFKVRVFISEIICCVFGSNENLHTHTHTNQRPLLQEHVVLWLVTWGSEWGRIGNERSEGLDGQISLRGGVALKAEMHESQWEEPKNQSLSEYKLANFNKNMSDIHDF